MSLLESRPGGHKRRSHGLGGFAQLRVGGRDNGSVADGFAQLTVAGRGDGGVNEAGGSDNRRWLAGTREGVDEEGDSGDYLII